MLKKNAILLCMLGVGFLVTFAIGCVQVDVPERIEVGNRDGNYYERDYRDRDYRDDDYRRDRDRKKIDKDDAYHIAKKIAKNHGAELRDYEIKDKKVEDNYWILFEHKHPSRRRGWQNHFAVRVGKYGRVSFYKHSSN